MGSEEVHMTLATAPRRLAVSARRFGYVVAVLINAAILYAANGWPGWETVPFLSGDVRLVIGLVNASIIANVVANVVYLAHDPPWLKALGDALATTVGIVALLRIWQVFPFDFASYSFDWTLVARILLVVGIVGSAIGIVAGLVSFVKKVATRSL
jgi:hypothetical protein